MADYKMTLYFGAGEVGKQLQETTVRAARQKNWSLNEFGRYCVNYTLQHDPSLKDRRAVVGR